MIAGTFLLSWQICLAKDLSHFTHRCQMFSWADLTCTCNLSSRSNDLSHFSHEYQMCSCVYCTNDIIVLMRGIDKDWTVRQGTLQSVISFAVFKDWDFIVLMVLLQEGHCGQWSLHKTSEVRKCFVYCPVGTFYDESK